MMAVGVHNPAFCHVAQPRKWVSLAGKLGSDGTHGFRTDLLKDVFDFDFVSQGVSQSTTDKRHQLFLVNVQKFRQRFNTAFADPFQQYGIVFIVTHEIAIVLTSVGRNHGFGGQPVVLFCSDGIILPWIVHRTRSSTFSELLTQNFPMNQPNDFCSDPENNWEILAGYLEAFLDAWENDGFGPPLGEHLPEDPGSLRKMVLIELIKVDLEYRHNGEGPVLQLEDYLAEHPELGEPDGIPIELIQEEHHLRRVRSGNPVDTDEYIARFPEKAGEIRRRLPADAASEQERTGQQLSEQYQPGDHIGDFYLMSALGTGAFGSVFLARQESMQRLVALKVSNDKGTEAQTLAQLDHPNIVRVHDQVRLPVQSIRLLYMQFVAGGTLQSVVKASQTAENKNGRLVADCIANALDHSGISSIQNVSLNRGLADKSWAEVTGQLGMELAQALHYAHEQGVLHRDLKPANVLLEVNGSAKLADFNISFSSEVIGDTAAASFGGSLAYMSPEQLEVCHSDRRTQADDLDERSDVFSLGILLWELMYGKRPFPDETVTENWNQTLDDMTELRGQGVGDPPTPPANATEELLVLILRRCLEPDPENRFRTADELARELGLCLQPQVAKLIRSSETGWRKAAVTWPMPAFLFAAIVPHIFAACFNYFYNETKIIRDLTALTTDQPDQSQLLVDKFRMLVIVINLIAFSIAFGLCISYIKPIVRAIRRDGDRTGPSPAAARIRSLRLSRFVTILGITEWGIAGLAYPLALYLFAGSLDAVVPIYFIGSLVICGLLAAAYPFFLTATLTIRAYFPALLRHDCLTSQDVNRLQALSMQSAWSLYLAGGVPAVGMLILIATGEGKDSLGGLALLVLSVLGAIGFAFALCLSRTLQRDIEALHDAYRLTSRNAQKT